MRCQKSSAFVLAAMMIAVLSLVGGCGKKGPPLPPLKDGNEIAPPANLAYTLEKNRVLLTWTHTVDPVDAKIPPERFEVFVATKETSGCEGCPFIFKSAGIVPMPKMDFAFDLQPGLNYYVRMQSLGSDKLKSGYSKTLYIDRN